MIVGCGDEEKKKTVQIADGYVNCQVITFTFDTLCFAILQPFQLNEGELSQLKTQCKVTDNLTINELVFKTSIKPQFLLVKMSDGKTVL